MSAFPIPRLFAAAFVLTVAAAAQTEPKLTARELFYTPVSNVKPAAKTEPTKPPARRAAQAPKRTPKRTVPDEGEGDQVAKQRQNDPGERAHYTTVGGLSPLGLRYSILKRGDDDVYNEVDPETVFRSGDRIRVSVEANDAAYLYIVQQGSSKTWNVLFPNAENGDNRIERSRQYVIPSGARFTFDDQPGTERLFIIVSRRPEPSIEGLIYSLSTGTPVRNDADAAKPKMLLAQARPIDDRIIAGLRTQMVARDLVFEKVDESKPGPRKETAMYVATQDRTPDARIVVDLNLNHR